MAGSITVSSITLDSDNTFRILSNTGATLVSANGTGIISGIALVSNSAISGVITAGQLATSLNLATNNVQVASIQSATGTPALTIAANGQVTLANTPLQLTGGQIQFPATQIASSDANTLDDYEEGTFTPNVGGSATYTAQQGYYTKVGQLVFAQFHLTINSIGSGTANQIYGLPFASKNDGSAPGIHIGYFATWNTASYYIGGYKNAADSSIILTNTTTLATAIVNGASMLKNGSDLYCSVTYIAA